MLIDDIFDWARDRYRNDILDQLASLTPGKAYVRDSDVRSMATPSTVNGHSTHNRYSGRIAPTNTPTGPSRSARPCVISEGSAQNSPAANERQGFDTLDIVRKSTGSITEPEELQAETQPDRNRAFDAAIPHRPQSKITSNGNTKEPVTLPTDRRAQRKPVFGDFVRPEVIDLTSDTVEPNNSYSTP